MKKKLLFALLFIASIGVFYTINTQQSDADKLREKHKAFLKNHHYNQSLALSKKERKAKGLPPNKYFEQEYLLEINPNTGRTHPENYIAVQKELKENKRLQRVPGDANDNMWVERGPNNVGGRTRVVMYDPNDANNKRVFAGGVTGGLWVNDDITDANSSWIRVGIDENLAVSCMTVDPNNSMIMYLGTGESQANPSGEGNGVWKSTDGGTTWANIYSDNFNTTLRDRLYYINTIKAWNNGGSTEVFLGVAGAYDNSGDFPGANINGLFKSVDDGANWARVTLPSIPGISGSGANTFYEPNEIEIGPDNTIWIGTNTNIWGNGGGTILNSTDGTSFVIKHEVPDGNRTEIALSTTDLNKIYVLNSTSDDPTMWVTTDGFATVTEITTPADADTGISNTDFTRGQSWYDLMIAVDPTDDAKVYVGGIDLFRSTDSGTNWTQISKWHNFNGAFPDDYFSDTNLPISVVHADQHGWAFHPTDPNQAVIGNDGGVFYATTLSGADGSLTAISARNKEYNVTQFYHGEIGQDGNNELLVSGAQDNGTQFLNGATAGINSAIEVRGGDGAYSWIDKDGAYMIAAYVYNNIDALNLPYDGTRTDIISEDEDTGYTGSFINPTVLDDNLDILYSNGAIGTTNRTGNLYRFTDLTGTPVKTTLTKFVLDDDATALAVSPYTTGSTSLFVGTASSKVIRLLNADTTPVWTDISGPSFTGSVSEIAFGANEDEIIVTFHNYGVANIWYTEDGGTTWTDKEGDFPDIPVKTVMMNPLNNDEVIIGTQLGVWRTANFKDASPNWVQSENGMSNVKVTSFSLRTSDNTVLATTYGRGMFTGTFIGAAASIDEVIAGTKVFTMYPTVSEGDFTLFAKNTLGKSTLKIYDINGKLVFTQQVDFNLNSKQPVSVQLNSGMYLVNLFDENNARSTGKIIIK